MLNPKILYYQYSARALRDGEAIYQRIKSMGAECFPVDTHWQIPELHSNEDLVEQFTKVKREVLVLGVKSSIGIRENGRSTDFIAPSHSNGCTAACTYCYVVRRKGYVNPITIFANYREGIKFVERHATKLGPKRQPNQCDPEYWIYDIGENSDCSIDATLSPAVSTYVDMFRGHPYAKGSFATKFVNRDLLDLNPEYKTRIRFSLMPAHISKLVDVRTDSVEKRLAAINDFYNAGWEVHVNLSPVITYPGWLEDWRELLSNLNDSVANNIKPTVKAEVIFLTHNEALHNINMQWHPKGEEILWKPEVQEDKVSQTGGCNIRYRRDFKTIWIQQFKDLVAEVSPWLEIRYIF